MAFRLRDQILQTLARDTIQALNGAHTAIEMVGAAIRGAHFSGCIFKFMPSFHPRTRHQPKELCRSGEVQTWKMQIVGVCHG
jgi:hypothetical protein